jgi:hypothetical protein
VPGIPRGGDGVSVLAGINPRQPIPGGTTITATPGDSLDTLYAAANRGDVIYLPPGSYPAVTIHPASKAWAPGNVTFWANPGTANVGAVICGASQVSFVGLTSDQMYVSPRYESAGTVCRDVSVRDCDLGLAGVNGKSRHVEYIGNKIHGRTTYVNTNSEISADGSEWPIGVLYERNEFYDIEKNPAGSDHIDALHPLAGEDITIRKNKFRNYSHYAVILTTTANTPTNVLIEDNWAGPSTYGLTAFFLGNTRGDIAWQYRTVILRRNTGTGVGIGSSANLDASSNVVLLENRLGGWNNLQNGYAGLTLRTTSFSPRSCRRTRPLLVRLIRGTRLTPAWTF